MAASDPRLPKLREAIVDDRELHKSFWLDVVARAPLHYIACVDPPAYSCPMGVGLSTAAEAALEKALKVPLSYVYACTQRTCYPFFFPHTHTHTGAARAFAHTPVQQKLDDQRAVSVCGRMLMTYALTPRTHTHTGAARAGRTAGSIRREVARHTRCFFRQTRLAVD